MNPYQQGFLDGLDRALTLMRQHRLHESSIQRAVLGLEAATDAVRQQHQRPKRLGNGTCPACGDPLRPSGACLNGCTPAIRPATASDDFNHDEPETTTVSDDRAA